MIKFLNTGYSHLAKFERRFIVNLSYGMSHTHMGDPLQCAGGKHFMWVRIWQRYKTYIPPYISHVGRTKERNLARRTRICLAISCIFIFIDIYIHIFFPIPIYDPSSMWTIIYTGSSMHHLGLSNFAAYMAPMDVTSKNKEKKI